MRFIGIDLGWMGKPSGYAEMTLLGRRLQLQRLLRIESHDEVLAALPAEGPAWIGLDAPVLIPNASGMREADRVGHELFSRQRAGCYPVHQGLPFAARLLTFSENLARLEFDRRMPQGRASLTRHVFEVYPHAASVRLFGLDRILPYKKGRLETRLPALAQQRELLAAGLKARTPAFNCSTLPPTGNSLQAMKACEDQLDAVLCAYIAAHFWYWGLARTNVLGDPSGAFIINPSF